jgi:type IV secretion system protein VirB9
VAADPRAAFQARAEQALSSVSDLPPAGSLPKAARDALERASAWKEDVQVPAPGEDGRVLYTYGAGLATVVCAPLKLCVIELQAGEQVVGEPHIGDSVRWNVSPAISGSGASAVTMVVIKPKEPNLDTNLVVPTNRRMYYVRLVSRVEQYLPLVAFNYPGDDALKWRQVAAAQERTKEEFEAAQLTPVESLENLNFAYTVTGGSEFLRPLRVLDDGRKTYIQMPEGTAVREAPVLVVAGLDSTAEMVNYRVKGSMYIVDQLFDHGALLLGAGKKQMRVDIVRAGSSAASKSASKSKVSKLFKSGKPDAIETAYLKREPPASPAASAGAAAQVLPKE